MDDDKLYDAVRRACEKHDPMPAGMVDRIATVVGELARHDADLEFELMLVVERFREMVGTRGGSQSYTLRFGANDVELLVRISTADDEGRARLDGWLVPSVSGPVQLRQVDGDKRTFDQSGRRERPLRVLRPSRRLLPAVAGAARQPHLRHPCFRDLTTHASQGEQMPSRRNVPPSPEPRMPRPAKLAAAVARIVDPDQVVDGVSGRPAAYVATRLMIKKGTGYARHVKDLAGRWRAEHGWDITEDDEDARTARPRRSASVRSPSRARTSGRRSRMRGCWCSTSASARARTRCGVSTSTTWSRPAPSSRLTWEIPHPRTLGDPASRCSLGGVGGAATATAPRAAADDSRWGTPDPRRTVAVTARSAAAAPSWRSSTRVASRTPGSGHVTGTTPSSSTDVYLARLSDRLHRTPPPTSRCTET